MEVVEFLKSSWDTLKLILVPEYIPVLFLTSFFLIEKTPLTKTKFLKRKNGKFWLVLFVATIYAALFSFVYKSEYKTSTEFFQFQIKLVNSYFFTLIFYHFAAKKIIQKYFTEAPQNAQN